MVYKTPKFMMKLLTFEEKKSEVNACQLDTVDVNLYFDYTFFSWTLI